MEIKVSRREGVQIVQVGEAKLTYPILSSFFTRVRELIEAGDHRLVIDLASVTYMDSASIGCLMDIHRLLQERSGVLRLCRLTPRVETMMSMTGVLKIIEADASVDDAVKALAERTGRTS
jgi:anti-anti-sigma factor